jgi:predicted Zn-dependent protease
MGWEHELAHTAGVHTCHTHDCIIKVGASAADLAQHLCTTDTP